MEIRELRTLCAVARFGSISKAAEQLSISQPSATRHLASLATSVGVPVVRPGSRPAVLTPDGQRLADLSAPILEMFDGLGTGGTNQAASTPVKVTANQPLAARFLPHVVGAFSSKHGLATSISTLVKERALQALADQTASIGVLPNPEVPADFSFEPIFEFNRVLLAPSGHPIADIEQLTWEDIAAYPLITRPGGSYSRWIVEPELRRNRLPFQTVLDIDNLDAAKEYVANGIGLAICPDLCVSIGDRARVEIIDVSHLLGTEHVGIVTVRGRQLTPSESLFVETLRDQGERFVSSPFEQSTGPGRGV